MDKVRSVGFFVTRDERGFRLEVGTWSSESGRVHHAEYRYLDLAELLCCVEAELEARQPGDSVAQGVVQPSLWRL
jgi:hypothetical protein